LNIDAATAALCSAVCLPIPVPGVCPVVCPPLILLAHAKCTSLVSSFIMELTKIPALVVKATGGALKMPELSLLPQFQKLDFCNALGLCPTTRDDCLPDCYRNGAATLSAGAGECRCGSGVSSCGKSPDCSPFGTCTGTCYCVNAWPNECKCLVAKPTSYTCKWTGDLASKSITLSDFESMIKDPAGAIAQVATASVKEIAKHTGSAVVAAVTTATTAPSAPRPGPGRKRDQV